MWNLYKQWEGELTIAATNMVNEDSVRNWNRHRQRWGVINNESLKLYVNRMTFTDCNSAQTNLGLSKIVNVPPIYRKIIIIKCNFSFLKYNSYRDYHINKKISKQAKQVMYAYNP